MATSHVQIRQPSDGRQSSELMTNINVSSNFYVTGGTLPPNANSYLERQADKDLLSALLAGEYCFVLNSRQMGKSSLSVRTIGRLNAAGVRTVFLDLTRFGGGTVTPDQWYVGMLAEAGRVLNLRKEVLTYWKDHQNEALVPRFFGAIHELALESPLVLFIDEIDAVKSLPFSTDEFFAGLRECYNRRVQDERMKRLTVCLVGSATPSDLIADTRTSPFNIGKRIELRDFTLSECVPLAEGVNRPNAGELVTRAFHWTNGHPYLMQSLCAAIAEDSSIKAASGVDTLVASLFFEAKARERNPNLADVSNRILSSYLDPNKRDDHRAAILDLYAKVLRGRPLVSDDETSRLVALLKLAGIVRSKDGTLVVRNRIYQRVFRREWIEQSMPDAELKRQKKAFRNGLARASTVAGVILSVMTWLMAYAFQQRNEARNNVVKANAATAKANAAVAESNYLLYISNMNLIQGAYDNNSFERIQELLDETGKEKYRSYRGFEWGYWNRLCHQDLYTIKGHPDYVVSAAFSPDGSRIVTASFDNTAKVWDAKTGKETLALKGHSGLVFSAAFSPDGSRIVTASFDKTAKVWDANSGREILTLKGHSDPVCSVAFSPDGSRIVTGNYDGTAKVWDAKTGREILTLKGHSGFVLSAAFSPDGLRIVTASWDKTAKVWDAKTGRETLTLKGHSYAVTSAAFSPDGSRIITGSLDYTAKVWDAKTSREPLTLKGSAYGIRSVSFSPDGSRIVTASEDKTAKVWDAKTDRETLTLKGHSGEVDSAAFSPDGSLIVTASTDKTAKVWDAKTGRETLTLKGHSSAVLSASFSPDGSRIVTGSLDETAKVWSSGPDHFNWDAYAKVQAEQEKKKTP